MLMASFVSVQSSPSPLQIINNGGVFVALIDSLKSMFKSETRVCSKCNTETDYKYLLDNNMICPNCNAYMRMGALERISKIADKDTFQEFDKSMKSRNIIDFPEYNDKLSKASKASN